METTVTTDKDLTENWWFVLGIGPVLSTLSIIRIFGIGHYVVGGLVVCVGTVLVVYSLVKRHYKYFYFSAMVLTFGIVDIVMSDDYNDRRIIGYGFFLVCVVIIELLNIDIIRRTNVIRRNYKAERDAQFKLEEGHRIEIEARSDFPIF